VTIEDDVVLLNATRLYQELGGLSLRGILFLHVPLNGCFIGFCFIIIIITICICVRRHGTTDRSNTHAGRRRTSGSFCRLPIGMFIARAGRGMYISAGLQAYWNAIEHFQRKWSGDLQS
jgi:hypothetical protein